MALDSFEEYDADINVAIVNQFGDNNISRLIQNGFENMVCMTPRQLLKYSKNYLEYLGNDI